MRLRDWSSDVCSSDLGSRRHHPNGAQNIQNARTEAEKEENDQSPWPRTDKTVEKIAQHGADGDGSDEFGGNLQSDGHAFTAFLGPGFPLFFRQDRQSIGEGRKG